MTSSRQHYDVKYIGTQKQLFIDDHIIESMNDVQKVLNQPEKYPENPIVKMDQPWEIGTYKFPAGRNMTEKEMKITDKEGMLFYAIGSIEYDKEEGIYKMWCLVTNYSWNDLMMCYLTSEDGINWEKPALGLVKYRGCDTNLILKGTKITPVGANVFKDPVTTDPDRRYKILWPAAPEGGYPLKGYPLLYPGFSPDGIHWTRWKGDPIDESDSQEVVYWDYKNQKYMACSRCFRKPDNLYLYEDTPFWVRMIGQMESIDFEHWSDIVPIVKADEKDGPYDRQFYDMNVMQYEGVYIGFLRVYHITPQYEGKGKKLGPKLMDNVDVQLTFSRDGRTWMRAGNREVFLANSEDKRSYDYGLIWPLQTSLPIIVKDEIWIYYIGQPGLHWFCHRGEPQESSICLAKLRLDGFISINSTDKGALTTKPFPIVEGSDVQGLEINFETTKQGSVCVEVLDLQGRPIPGFTKDDCDAFSGDEIHQVVTWNGKTDISKLEGTIVKFRFYLDKAKLFSFQLFR